MGTSTESAVQERREVREFLRHTLATLAYRAGKALRDAPESFADYRAGDTSRKPAQILAHLGDLMEWSLRLAQSSESWRSAWRSVPPQEWSADVDRFFAALKALDDFLQTAQPLAMSPELLFQGPIADALTHVGQLAMLRRLSGAPSKSEVLLLSEIVAGRVGLNQSAPVIEFD